MRSHNRTQTIMRVIDSGGPFPHRLGYGILECCRTGRYRNDLGAEQPHAVYVERLASGVFFAHKYGTGESHKCCRRSRGNTVLTCSCLCDQSCFTHLLCKKCLTEYIIYFVGTCVVKILSFKIYLCSSQILCHLFGIIKKTWSSCIIIK